MIASRELGNRSTSKVLFVVGMARSGSTLLTALLDRVDGFAGLGEVHLYWELVGSGRRCGCRQSLDTCAVWGALQRAHEEEDVDIAEMRGSFRSFVRPRPSSVLRSLRAQRGGRSAARLARYSETMEGTYRWLAERTGAEVIVDSTKLPAAADLTAAMAGVDTFVVHLVRDPRAIAHSLASRRREAGACLPGFGPLLYLAAAVRAALDWTLRNAYVEMKLRRSPDRPYLRLRFEDLTRDPQHALARLLKLVDGGAEADIFAGENAVEFGENHILTGDASRFERGLIEIAPQESWRGAMPRYARVAVTLLTAPLLSFYGYALLPGR